MPFFLQADGSVPSWPHNSRFQRGLTGPVCVVAIRPQRLCFLWVPGPSPRPHGRSDAAWGEAGSGALPSSFACACQVRRCHFHGVEQNKMTFYQVFDAARCCVLNPGGGGLQGQQEDAVVGSCARRQRPSAGPGDLLEATGGRPRPAPCRSAPGAREPTLRPPGEGPAALRILSLLTKCTAVFRVRECIADYRILLGYRS